MSASGCVDKPGNLQKMPNSLEILGELSLYKQCVQGSFLSAHVREPGNEATMYLACVVAFFCY